jgi:hypothetical protein
MIAEVTTDVQTIAALRLEGTMIAEVTTDVRTIAALHLEEMMIAEFTTGVQTIAALHLEGTTRESRGGEMKATVTIVTRGIQKSLQEREKFMKEAATATELVNSILIIRWIWRESREDGGNGVYQLSR